MAEITFVEIGTEQPKDAGPFFQQLFGWTFSLMGDEGGGFFETPTIKIGLHGRDPNPGMVPYFHVEDIEKAAETVRQLGGHADLETEEEEGFGRFCTCSAPGGIRFGLHQSPK